MATGSDKEEGLQKAAGQHRAAARASACRPQAKSKATPTRRWAIPACKHWQASYIDRDGLQDRGNIFFAAVEMTRMPMVVTDPRQPDNPIVFANGAFFDLTGYSDEEVARPQLPLPAGRRRPTAAPSTRCARRCRNSARSRSTS